MATPLEGPSASLPEAWARLAPPPRPLTGNDKYTVFLSYRSVDRAWVVNLYDVLKRFGHQVFLDQVVLAPGQRLTSSIEDGLMRSQAGVLVWSTAAKDSGWVREEYETMHRLSNDEPGFVFVPVRLDRAPLPSFAANRIFLDFSAYPDGPNGGELLRLLHALVGQPLSDDALRFAVEQDDLARRLTAQVAAAIRIGDSARLVELHRIGGLPWRASAALGCKAAQGLIKLRALPEATAMLEALVREFPRAIRPKQLQGVVLTRQARDHAQAGRLVEADEAIAAAQRLLGELEAEGERDPETLGIFAATWKERHARSGSALDLRQSRDLYAQAFAAARDDYYVGINAASTSVLLGGADVEKGRAIARDVQAIVGTTATAGDYWATATAAECLLILGDYAAAGALYQAAVDAGRAQIGEHESTWLQASRLLRALHATPAHGEHIRRAFEHLPPSANV